MELTSNFKRKFFKKVLDAIDNQSKDKDALSSQIVSHDERMFLKWDAMEIEIKYGVAIIGLTWQGELFLTLDPIHFNDGDVITLSRMSGMTEVFFSDP